VSGLWGLLDAARFVLADRHNEFRNDFPEGRPDHPQEPARALPAPGGTRLPHGAVLPVPLKAPSIPFDASSRERGRRLTD
jgi:hypothetical protein